MYSIILEWKEFSVDLRAIETWLRAESDLYSGSVAADKFTLYFSDEPSEEIKEAIQAKWDELEEDSDEAVSYQSQAAIRADVEAKKASAKAKLIALGLSEEEVEALRS